MITTKEARKKVEKLRNKIGLNIWDELMDEFWKMELKIEELKKSREKWKENFFKLQLENEELKRELR